MGLLSAEDFPNVRFLRFLRRQLFRFQKADVCLYSVAKKERRRAAGGRGVRRVSQCDSSRCASAVARLSAPQIDSE